MINNLSNIIDEFLGEGASLYNYSFSIGETMALVKAYVRSVHQPASLQHFWERWEQVRHHNVTWLFHFREFPTYTTAEAIESARLRIPLPDQPYSEDLWLILDRSLHCQLSLIDNFGYSDGSIARNERLIKCKEVFAEIYDYQQCSIFTVSFDGKLGIIFDQKLNKQVSQIIFDMIADFIKSYATTSTSLNMLRKEFMRTRCIILGSD